MRSLTAMLDQRTFSRAIRPLLSWLTIFPFFWKKNCLKLDFISMSA